VPIDTSLKRLPASSPGKLCRAGGLLSLANQSLISSISFTINTGSSKVISDSENREHFCSTGRNIVTGQSSTRIGKLGGSSTCITGENGIEEETSEKSSIEIHEKE
jgi:hypothetical protein